MDNIKEISLGINDHAKNTSDFKFDLEAFEEFLIVSVFSVCIALLHYTLQVDLNVYFLSYMIVFGYVFYICLIKYKSIMSLKSLFLLGNLFVFSIPIIYIGFFYSGDWVSYKYSPVSINSNELAYISFVILTGISGFLFGYSLPVRKNKTSRSTLKSKYVTLILILVTVSFVMIAYRRYELIKFVSMYGFDAIYNRGFNTSFISSILAYLFFIFSPILYLMSNSKKVKGFVVFLILSEAFLHGIAGQRVWIFMGGIQVLYLMSIDTQRIKNRNVLDRIKLLIMLLISGVLGIYLMSALLFYREGLEFDPFNVSLMDYFIGQFGTIVGLKIAIGNFDYVYGSIIPPIFDTLNVFRPVNQDVVNELTTNIGTRVTNIYCGNCLAEGKSYGSSIYMQLYQFKFIGVFIGTTILGYFASLIDTNKSTVFIYTLIGFFMVKHYVWLPRGEYFPHYISIVSIIVGVLSCFILSKIYVWRNNENQ